MMPLLNGLDDEVLGTMMMLMTQLRLVSGQVLYLAEELGDEMYFLVEGRVQVTRYDNLLEDRLTPIRDSEVATREAGDTLGELVLFPEICKYRGETVVARENCTLFVLTRSNLQVLSDSHPVVEVQFRVLCTLLSIESKVTNACMSEWILEKERGKQSEVEIDVRILELSDKVPTLSLSDAADSIWVPLRVHARCPSPAAPIDVCCDGDPALGPAPLFFLVQMTNEWLATRWQVRVSKEDQLLRSSQGRGQRNSSNVLHAWMRRSTNDFVMNPETRPINVFPSARAGASNLPRHEHPLFEMPIPAPGTDI